MIVTLGEIDLVPLPDRFTVRCGHRIVEFPVPGWTVFQDAGAQPKEFTISGVFVGPDALENALRLSAMEDEGTPPELVVEVGNSVRSWIVRLRSVNHEIIRGGHCRYQIEAVEEQAFRSDFTPAGAELSSAEAVARQLAEAQRAAAQLPPSILERVQSALFNFGLKLAEILSAVGNIGSFAEMPADILNTVLWNLDFMATQLELAISDTEVILTSGSRTFSAAETGARRLNCILRGMQKATGEMKARALATPKPQRMHTVLDGETLQSISALYYGSFSQWPLIARANNIDDPADIRPGQELIIPSGQWEGSWECE